MKFEKLLNKADLIIDGLLGYNISGNPRGIYSEIINLANSSGRKILAIDIPSGLNPDTGEIYNPCIRAKYTLALTLPKNGLIESHAKQSVGDLYVADLGLPPEIYQLMSLEVPNMFNKKGIVKV